MRSSIAGTLGLFLSALSSISALDLLPNHARPEMLVIPPNVTIMTPRTRNSAFEQQIFDFGSAQSGFSELRHILERQSMLPSGRALLWGEDGCDDQGCCAKGQQCCKGGSCCKGGNNCVIINGQPGCCPIGQTCTPPPVCQDAGYSLCPDEKFCCPTGYQCYRDAAGNAKCRNPNAPPSTSSEPPEPSTTYVPPPPPDTSEAETSTYVPPPPPPDTQTIVIPTTRTQVVTQTYQVTQTSQPAQTPQPTFQPGSSSSSRATSSARTSQAVQTGAVIGSNTKTNVGAIAGGVVAGVVAIVVLVLVIIFWRRHQRAGETPAAGPQPNYPPVPPNTNQHNPSGLVPPTPNSGDPFLTPMGQHQNLGVSYFNGAPVPGSLPSGSNSGTGPYNISPYSGLPEPQQNEMSGSALPMPRYDLTHPHPLPMTVVHSQQPQPQMPSARPWSGYVQPPGVNPAPYADSNNSQPSGWAAPTNNGWASPPPQGGNVSPPHADQSSASVGVARPPSTVYQPSSHLAYSPPASPPGSPPVPDVYGGMAASGSGGGGLPAGAAPPMNVYGPEKKSILELGFTLNLCDIPAACLSMMSFVMEPGEDVFEGEDSDNGDSEGEEYEGEGEGDDTMDVDYEDDEIVG
ncbi:hypothetical protein FRC06_004771, partial [Ceratobasidium sp. 370]